MRSKKPKEPFISQERHDTIRHLIKSLLESGELNAREISSEAGISEKDIYPHLEHVRKSEGHNFILTPSVCNRCGFIFHKRDRLKKPGKCPKCRSESIEAPRYSIKR